MLVVLEGASPTMERCPIICFVIGLGSHDVRRLLRRIAQ